MNKFQISNSQQGYTLVELLVVVAIIVALTAVVLSNFPQAKLQFSLGRVAYKFQQDGRRAEELALSSTQFTDSAGPHSIAGYGIYVDQANPKQYIIYADSVPGNHHYDPGADYIVETVDFGTTEPGIVMQQFNNVVGTTLSVNFAPPNPVTTITPTSSSVDVVFAQESDTSKTKTVSINSVGLIEVK